MRCMKLARLCSQAVDYAKNGNPVDIHNNLPKPLNKFKPDWHKAEVTGARELDYYVSDRALGELYRNIKLTDPKEPIEDLSVEGSGGTAPLEDPISRKVAPLVRSTLKTTRDDDDDPADSDQSDTDTGHAEQLHAHYVREMRFICMTHTLVDAPDVRLTEEEVVLGTILANCTQSRWRTDRSYRMKLHAEELVNDIRTQIVPQREEGEEPPTEEQLKEQLRIGLRRAWAAWCWAQNHRDEVYFESFALLVLGIVFDCLKRLGALPENEIPFGKK
jgi:RNA-dependent RNA polymerase